MENSSSNRLGPESTLDQGITVISGCMFSGKTTSLISRVHSARESGLKALVFKPKIDDRYSLEEVVSHDQKKCEAKVVRTSEDIKRYLEEFEEEVDLIAVDEAQFFDDKIVDFCQEWVGEDKKVLLAGLDTDWRGKPFGPVPELMAVADQVEKLKARCATCGEPARRTHRLVKSRRTILVGSDEYEPRCHKHL